MRKRRDGKSRQKSQKKRILTAKKGRETENIKADFTGTGRGLQSTGSE
jgi:hypothetical protein